MPQKSSVTKRALGPTGLIVFSGLLMTLSSMSVDIMLPAFKSMSSDLQTPIPWVQGTIPAFLLASALGQLVYGPLSDKYGRKPVLAIGLITFVVGAAVAAYGSTIAQVLVGRAIQGFGVAAGPVLGRAILRDTFSGSALGQAMAGSMAIFAIGPIIAPLLGFGIVAVLDWRSIFLIMGIIALGLLTINLTVFEESNIQKNKDALSVTSLWQAFSAVFQNAQSRYFLLLACAAYASLLSFISNASRIYSSSLGSSDLEFAVLFAITGTGIILGQLANRWALHKIGILPTLRIASFVLFFSSIASTAMAFAQVLTPGWFTVLMFAFNTSFLVVFANSLTLILDPHPRIAGLVSAVFGFFTTLAGSIFVSATFDVFDGDALTWGIAMSALTATSFAGFAFARRDSLSFDKD